MSQTPSDNALEVNDVSLDYTTHGKITRAVECVSFVIPTGQRLVLMGHSGCGKSTLLKAVGGFLQATEGNIKVYGRPVQAPGPDRMIIWQDLDQLLPWKTIEANVAYPLLLVGTSKAEAKERALYWIHKVGLDRALGNYPHQLSGGMKQRVAIARGFAAKPAVLLMDEPFSALDALTRHQLQDELITLQEESNITLLFVSHDASEAIRIGQHILVLSPHPGRVKALLDNSKPGTGIEKQLHNLLFESH